MNEINSASSRVSHVHDDLISRSARFGGFGWLAFFITLILLLLQNAFYSLKPKEVMAERDGVIVGQVMFDEVLNRDKNIVLADIKTWSSRCVSINKLSVYEDLAVCLTHMEKELADEKISFYEESNYAPYIEAFGCEKTETRFDSQRTEVFSKKGKIYANIYGEVICNVTGERPKSQEFAHTIEGDLYPKTESLTLGFRVSEYGEIE